MGNDRTVSVDVSAGAERIMETLESVHPIDDISGEAGTNVGGMLEKVRLTMAQLTNKSPARCIHPRLASRRCSCSYQCKGRSCR